MFKLFKRNSMKLENKFNLGDVIFYPAADFRNAKLIKSTVTGILVTGTADNMEVSYQTAHSAYAIKESDVSDNADGARAALLGVLKTYKEKVNKSISDAMKSAKKAKVDDILYDGTAENEETEPAEAA